MNVSCQSIINVERPWQGITDLKNAGLDRIFLPIYAEFPKAKENAGDEKTLKRYSLESIVDRYEAVMDKCRESNIQIAFLKVPVIPQKADIWNILPMMETSITQSLELCRGAECDLLLMELPVQYIENGGEEKRAIYDYFVKAAVKARKYGVMLLLKNQTRNINGHLARGFCAEADEAAEWIDRLNNELGYNAFGFCVDVGICNVCGNDIQTYISILGNCIRAVILKDNDGQNDVSMLPFTLAGSGTDWLGVIRGLRNIGFDGELAVDFSSTYNSFSPLLRPILYPLVRETAEYFRWQIEIENNLKKYKNFVLFGAGNMCRNYMKCYGEKYPPLFTCDNNSKIWGTIFEGLEVKKPEDLKYLPRDCCVVICNIYYREIEVQLREMGIENIGYFNDEYMPSFYFDRLGNR